METVKFGDLYLVPTCNGLTRPSSVRGQGYKMVNMGELFSNDIIREYVKMERVQMSEKEQEKFSLKKYDLLFARQSLVASGAGKCSIIKELNELTTFESHLIRVRLDKSIVNPVYYYYLFQLPYNPVKTIINQCAQAGIRGSELCNIKVPKPSLSIQNKIVNILSTYDDLIENNNKRIKILEQMAENLYKEWFVRFRFPEYENAEFENGIPKGWSNSKADTKIPKTFKYGELQELGIFTRGKNLTASQMIDGNIPVISAGVEPSGYHNKANVSGISLTISSSGANAGYLKYNLEDIWAADCSYYQNDENIWFVYNTLKYLQPVIKNMQCGAAQPHVYPKHINRLCILIPSEELIKIYNDICNTIYNEIRNINKQINNLTQQRDLLLPRLMSGKLEVE